MYGNKEKKWVCLGSCTVLKTGVKEPMSRPLLLLLRLVSVYVLEPFEPFSVLMFISPRKKGKGKLFGYFCFLSAM